ncbi:MAG TPA: DUF4252 domain-containing protein [Verrucomicrobiae bacterium]|jgi:hypothetical protein
MKNSIRSLVAAGAVCLALASAVRADEGGFVDFGTLNPTGENQFVEVNIKSNLIAMVAALTKKTEPEVTQVIEGLKQIRVNVLGLTKENRDDMKNRVKTIRDGLDKAGWERIVTAVEKNQDVGIFLKTKDAKTVEGVCVTVLEKNQVVLVNVVGNIQPEKLSMVGERFDVEPLKHIPARPHHKAPKPDTDAEKDSTKS